MAGDARCLVEELPAFEVGLNSIGKVSQDFFDSDLVNKAHHVFDRHKGDIGEFRRRWGHLLFLSG